MSEVWADGESVRKLEMAKRTRQKVKHEFIVKGSSRRITFRKRKNSLLKKVNELSVLCGVSVCLVICWAEQPEPIVWPSTQTAKELLRRFVDLPETEKCSRTVDQEAYLRDKMSKMEVKLERLQRKNREAVAFRLMHQIFNEGRELRDLDMEELDALLTLVVEKLKLNLGRDDFGEVPVDSRAPLAAGTSAAAAGGQPEVFSAAGMDRSMLPLAENVCGGGGAGGFNSSSLKIPESESSGSYMALLLRVDDGDGGGEGDIDDGKAIEGSSEKKMASADANAGGKILEGDGSSTTSGLYDMFIGDGFGRHGGYASIWDMSDESFLKLVGFGEADGEEGVSWMDGGSGVPPPSETSVAGGGETAGLSEAGPSNKVNMS